MKESPPVSLFFSSKKEMFPVGTMLSCVCMHLLFIPVHLPVSYSVYMEVNVIEFNEI